MVLCKLEKLDFENLEKNVKKDLYSKIFREKKFKSGRI
nr:MAG TPA: hypothetical protein [Caudoviricetes sp.]